METKLRYLVLVIVVAAGTAIGALMVEVLRLAQKIASTPEPAGLVTIVVPDDLRKLPCVPMQYLLSNRRISKIHSYSKDLKLCGSKR